MLRSNNKVQLDLRVRVQPVLARMSYTRHQRRFKMTDGDHSRFRVLGSIDIFISFTVTLSNVVRFLQNFSFSRVCIYCG